MITMERAEEVVEGSNDRGGGSGGEAGGGSGGGAGVALWRKWERK